MRSRIPGRIKRLMDNKRIFLEACVLVAFGALFGLTMHYQLVIDAFSGRLVPPTVAVQNETAPQALPMPVLLDEVQQLRDTGALLVDARSPELYAAGHIEGAVSLPLITVDSALDDFLAEFDKDRVMIVYCSGFGCPDSFDLGVFLIEAGYTDVRVFEGGFPEWRDRGLPVAGTDS
jgi:rhodanese-related sulfurtransferase